MDTEKKVKVIVTCPPRQNYGGYGSAGLYFPNGRSEHELHESVVKAMRAEVAAGHSILGIELAPEAPPPPAPVVDDAPAAVAVVPDDGKKGKKK